MNAVMWTVLLIPLLGGCARQQVDCRPDVLLASEQVSACEDDCWHQEDGTMCLDGVDLPWTFSITNRGNGGFEIAGVLLRLYDGHDDGKVFEPALLQSCWIERNGRRIGFALCGVQQITVDDDDNPIETRFRKVAVDCTYDGDSKKLTVTGDRDVVVIAD